MNGQGGADKQRTVGTSSYESGGQTAENDETSSSLTRRATGPRTRQGKEKSKRNALKDGIFSTVVVIGGESRADFKNLLNGLRAYLLPDGALEEILVEKLAVLFWRERRLLIADGKEDIRSNQRDSFELKEPRRWDLLLRYEATLDRAIDRTLNQLERYQRLRLGHPVPPPINVNVSSS